MDDKRVPQLKRSTLLIVGAVFVLVAMMTVVVMHDNQKIIAHEKLNSDGEPIELVVYEKGGGVYVAAHQMGRNGWRTMLLICSGHFDGWRRDPSADIRIDQGQQVVVYRVGERLAQLDLMSKELELIE